LRPVARIHAISGDFSMALGLPCVRASQLGREIESEMFKTTVRFLFVLWFTVAGAAAAFAQAGDAPDGEVYVGYSAVSFDGGNRHTAVHGFDVSAAGNLSDWFGLVGEVSGHYRGGDAVHYVMGGPRVTLRSGGSRVEPFAHALVGGAFLNSSGHFSMAVGGGLDVRVNDKIAIRAIQADYAPIFFEHSTAHNARFSAGVVFRF
jgi:hypothetical protein